MEAGGFTLADYPHEEVEIWPENLAAYELFVFMRTQWRGAGMGIIGLDYGPLYHKMDRMGLSKEDYEMLEADIQVMEIEAIATMNDREE